MHLACLVQQQQLVIVTNSTETTEATGTAKIQKTMEVLPDEEPPAEGEAEPPANERGGQ
jgi:hypothetical protein